MPKVELMNWWPWKKRPDVQKAQPRPELLQAAVIYREIAEAISDLYQKGAEREANPEYNWDREAGCNVGTHICRAAALMETYLERVPDGPPGTFLPAAAQAIHDSRQSYLERYYDPDWFGIGAHNLVLRTVLSACDQHEIARPSLPETLADGAT